MWTFLLCFVLLKFTRFSNAAEPFSPYEYRPRMLVHEGHMYFRGGRDKNITFTADGRGTIFFDKIDLKTLPSLGHIKLYTQQLSSLQSNCESVRTTVTTLTTTQQTLDQNIRTMQTQITNASLTQLRDKEEEAKSLKRKVKRTEANLDKLKTLVNTNDCATNPCQNGGTCIDLVGQYICLCQSQFTGPNCSIDVDECAMLGNTELACQNGGTCVNTHGGFKCTCPRNYFGFRCTESKDSCDTGSSHAMCGPAGTCKPNSNVGQAAYRCICDPGYKSNNSPNNPQCEDIDECVNNPCFPRVTCINTPGSFRCGSCPTGFTGNGMQCWDIDECGRNNGGCSTAPMVQCINTYGSFHCGPCPPGYQGNGQTCSNTNVCESNPCYALATCTPMAGSLTGYICQCPPNMVGNGIGASGCRASLLNACSSSPCRNGGTCQSFSATRYFCHCPVNYQGAMCQFTNGCASNPCLHNGTCVTLTLNLNLQYPGQDYTCWCTRDWHGRHCEIQEEGCNGNFAQDSGTFTYPADFIYKSLLNCEWTFTGGVNKILNITFPMFDLENSTRPGCPFDNLTLYDGPNSDASVLGVYCSCKGCPKAPDAFIITSTNQLFIRFRTDLTISHRGFTINWTSINPLCGGRITGDTGRITSPNYPSMYGRNLHCLWMFSNQPNNHYKLEFGEVELQVEHINCTKDKIEVRDGQRLDSPLLAQYCTSSPGSPFTSSLPFLSVYFRSVDVDRTSTLPPKSNGGFLLTYNAVPMDRTCGGTLTADQGAIKSPNFGQGNYFNDLNCIWIIDGANVGASIVELTFVEFDVRGSSVVGNPYVSLLNPDTSRLGGRYGRSFRWRDRILSRRIYRCVSDFVEIRDGNSDLSPLLGNYCGKDLPPPIASSSSKMYVRFSTDAQNTAKGFFANYKIKCGNVLQGRNGTFQSPNYPMNYASSIQCEYIVKAPESYAILVKFTEVNLGNTSPLNCSNNYIEMQSSPANAWHNRKFCYVPIGRVFTTSGGSYKVIFKTDGSVLNKGFQATFETMEVGCGGTLNGRYGVIQSPKNGDEYLHNMVCRWFIEVPVGFAVRLNFQTFVLEEHRNCAFDYVAVYETYTNENDTTGFKGKYCGEMRPPSLLSSTNTMVVVFGTDSSISRAGFEASYEAVNATAECDRTLVDTEGYIENYGFPEPLTRSSECEYHIQVSRGFKVLLTVQNLTLSCADGYIEIRNGPSANAPAIGGLKQSRMCGESRIDSIRSQGNMLYLKFKTQRISVNSRIIYRLTYEQIAQSCGSTMNAITGALSSPQYPFSSTQAYDCSWKISVAEGNRVSLIIGSFDGPVPVSIDCWPWASRLEVRDGPFLTSRLIDRICHHKTTVGTYQSTGNQLTVRYVLQSITAASGFLGHYSTVCNNIRLTGFTGRLESPGFPFNAYADRNCFWRIEGPPGSLLQLHFTHFKIDEDGRRTDKKCRNTFVEYGTGQVASVLSLGFENYTNITKFCNETFVPSVVYSKSNFIEMTFKSPVTMPANHFALEWQVNGCGGLYTESTTTLMATNETGDTKVNYHVCPFIIKAPVGKKIELKITFLGLSSMFSHVAECKYNKDTSFTGRNNELHIFNGVSNASGHAYFSLCDSVSPPDVITVTSTGSEMYVLLSYELFTFSPQFQSAAVFIADYKFIDGGCGAFLNATSGHITSPNFPNMFPTATECTWLIRVQPGYTVQLTITAFNMGSAVRTCLDPPPLFEGYISVYDGSNTTAPLLRRFCGNTLPDNPQVQSTGNEMFIKFQGASIEMATVGGTQLGFDANYSIACGGRLIADATVRSLESVRTSLFRRCDWVIEAQTPGEKVYLTVNFVALRSVDNTDRSAGCTSHYLEIYDGPEAVNETLMDTICGSSAPPTFVSTGSSLFLRLRTPAWFWDAKRHFMVTYTASASYCGGDYLAVKGAFNSPGYPQPYPPSTVCIWTIVNSRGNRIRLQFSLMNLKQSDYCSEDYVEVREESASGKYLGRFCGNQIPPPVEGYWKLWVKFHSDEDSSGTGFQASYMQLFGGDFSGTSGTIASPWYDQSKTYNWAPSAVFGTFALTKAETNETDGNLDLPRKALTQTFMMGEEAWWRIRVPSGFYVQITFDDFSIPTKFWQRRRQCWILFQLEVYDGYCNYQSGDNNLECTLSQTLCGIEIPQPWISISNTASLRLVAKFWQSQKRAKFLLQWTAVPSSRPNATETGKTEKCGGVLTASTEDATLTSPGYPYGYDSNLDCTWSISHPKVTIVVINITNVDLEPHINCQYDYVTIQQNSNVPRYSLARSNYYSMSNNLRMCSISRAFAQSITFTRQEPVEIIFRTDNSDNRTGFSLRYRLGCGGDFDLGSIPQKLKSPNYPSVYPAFSTCKWKVKVSVGRTIEVSVVNFQLEDSPECRKDYLKIYNGGSMIDPLLGTWCGTSGPSSPLTSTSNSMFIIFSSDNSGTAPGLSLVVREKKIQCSDDNILITEDNPEGTLTSPNYPDVYSHSLDCVWIIQAPSGSRIQFDFDKNHFDLETGRNSSCNFDSVEVRDGASIIAPLIGRYCGKTIPGSLYSTGSFLFVRMATDDSLSRKGFMAKYKLALCGGTVLTQVGSPGYITSPNYPQPYPSNTKCEWYIIAPEGHFISFSFVDISLMSSAASNCSADFVELKDGNDTGTSFGRFCVSDTDTMVPKRTRSEMLHVKFESDPHINTPGFKLEYNTSVEVCGGRLTEGSGILMSPAYPNPYPNKRWCHWYIRTATNTKIKLQFDDLHFPENDMGDCKYDGVRIYNGPSVDAPLVNTFCGVRKPIDAIYSTGDALTVWFYSDISITGRGFKASYVTLPGEGCGSDIRTETPVFRTPTKGKPLYCHWQIYQPNPANSSINIKFYNFNLDDNSGCVSNRLNIYGELTSMEASDPQNFCGNKGNFSMSFYQGVVHIHLYLLGASHKNQSVEFKVSFSNCGGVVSNRQGVITSPGYPQMYENNLDCPWLIVADEGQLIQVTLTFSNIEYQPSCAYDRLLIRNGPFLNSPVVRIYCNSTDQTLENHTFVSNSRRLLVQFQTDHLRTGGGFRLEYKQIQQGCGYVDEGDNGVIISPNYPNNYPNNLLCQWEIAASVGFHIRVQFNHFDVQQSDNCTKDFLLFQQLKTSDGRAVMTWSPINDSYCGYQLPDTIESQTEHVKLTFKSDAATRGSGFNISWNSVCGSTYTSPSGFITSPYYPRNYQSNMRCVYTIRPPEPGVMYTVLEFRAFELEAFVPDDCVDYVEVIEMFTNNSVAKLCGATIPDPVSTKGPMQIVFKTDQDKNYNGFIAMYKVSECGGEINIKEEPQLRSANIKSPTFPAKYQNNMNCIWKITGPPGRILNFKFTNLSMEQHANCEYDFVELIDGDNENATSIAKFCGPTAPSRHFKSSSNNMVVRFYSDVSVTTSIGFFGVVTSTLGPDSGCGGVINVTGSNPVKLTSPGGNGMNVDAGGYGRMLNCEWYVLAPRDKVIKVNVTKFVLENRSRLGKCFDYLDIYDGLYDTGAIVGSYCGTIDPWQFISSGDQMYFHFVTDYSIELAGFEIYVTTQDAVCGLTKQATDVVDTLSNSLTVPSPYYRCRWKITAPPQRKVTLTVTLINFPEGPLCRNGFLEISDVPRSIGRSVKDCGNQNGLRFTSASDTVLITAVYGPNQGQTYGFQISFQALQECNQTINADGVSNFGGRLTSPNFPEKYSNNLTCYTEIIAPADNKITIYFTNFTLEESSPSMGTCSYDFLQILEDGQTPLVFCGRTLPPTYTSTRNRIKLLFKTDSTVAFFGYDLNYIISDQTCGGTLFVDRGTITSPRYPQYYPEDLTCTWFIRVARGSHIKFTILSLSFSGSANVRRILYALPASYDDDDIEYDNDVSTTRQSVPIVGSRCSPLGDRLEIRPTRDSVEPIEVFCSAESLPIERSLAMSQMFVYFASNAGDGQRGTGFRLTFEAVPANTV